MNNEFKVGDRVIVNDFFAGPTHGVIDKINLDYSSPYHVKYDGSGNEWVRALVLAKEVA